MRGVVFGNKTENEDCRPVTVRDNVYFGIGVKGFRQVTIENNVSIGANAIVTKDIPGDVVVGSMPAKVLKIKLSFSIEDENLTHNKLYICSILESMVA